MWIWRVGGGGRFSHLVMAYFSSAKCKNTPYEACPSNGRWSQCPSPHPFADAIARYVNATVCYWAHSEGERCNAIHLCLHSTFSYGELPVIIKVSFKLDIVVILHICGYFNWILGYLIYIIYTCTYILRIDLYRLEYQKLRVLLQVYAFHMSQRFEINRQIQALLWKNCNWSN